MSLVLRQEQDRFARLESFAKYARFIAQQFDLRVEIGAGGFDPKTRSILIPDVSSLADSEIEFLYCALLQEAGRAKHSDFSAKTLGALETEAQALMAERLEEARCENKLLREFDGAQSILGRLHTDFALDKDLRSAALGFEPKNAPLWDKLCLLAHRRIFKGPSAPLAEVLGPKDAKALEAEAARIGMDKIISKHPIASHAQSIACARALHRAFFKTRQDRSEKISLNADQQRIEALKAALRAIPDQMKATNKQISKLSEKASALRSEINALESALEPQTSALRQNIGQTEAKIDQIGAAQDALRKAQRERAKQESAQAQTKNQEERAKKAQEKQSALQSKIDELAQAIQEAQKALNGAQGKAETEKAQAKKERLEERRASAQKNLEEAKASEQKAQTKAQAKSAQSQELERQAARAQQLAQQLAALAKSKANAPSDPEPQSAEQQSQQSQQAPEGSAPSPKQGQGASAQAQQAEASGQSPQTSPDGQGQGQEASGAPQGAPGAAPMNFSRSEDSLERAEERLEERLDSLEKKLDDLLSGPNAKKDELNSAKQELSDLKEKARKETFQALSGLHAQNEASGLPIDILPSFEATPGWEKADGAQKSFDQQARAQSGEWVQNGKMAGLGTGGRDTLVYIDSKIDEASALDPVAIFRGKIQPTRIQSMSKGLERSAHDLPEEALALNDPRMPLLRPHLAATRAHDAARFDNIPKNSKELTETKARLAPVIARAKDIFRARLRFAKKDFWRGNKEEGSIDARNVWKLATKQDDNFYEVNERKHINKVAASIAIDISGSQDKPFTEHGAKLRELALILSEGLGAAHVPHEILGLHAPVSHAMRESHGERAGSGFFNRRSNRLETVVYKRFEDKHNLGISNLEVEGSDNSDGESLREAFARLKKRNSQKRVLFVLTDGKPFLSDADTRILDADLHRALGEIKSQKCAVFAFGFNDAPRNFFGADYCKIKDWNDLLKFAQERLG